MQKNKVVVIGLDGATWRLINPWIKSGKLPFLKCLLNNGSYGTLKSTIPPMTAPAWASFQTGVNPGKHGVFDFVEYNSKGEEDIVSGKSIRVGKIWEFLEKNNKTSLIINMPVTYPPPQTKKSIIISSFLTPPGKAYVSPKILKKKLDKIGYKIDVKFEKYGLFVSAKKIARLRRKILNEVYNITDKRYKTLLNLANLRDWDFIFTLFRGTDTVQHLFWNNKLTLKYYQKIDVYLKKIYKFFKNKYKNRLYFLIISDHGFYKTPAINFSLYSWLYKNKYLNKPNNNESFFNRVNRFIYRKLISVNIIKDENFLREQEKHAIKEAEEFLVKIRRGHSIWASAYGLYVKNSKINKDELIKHLKNIKYKKDKVFKSVLKKEDIYSGKYLKNLPDIILMANFKFCLDANPFNFKLFTKKDMYLKGYHHSDREGIFIFNGKNVGKIKNKDEIKIYDIFPTILYLLNIKIPKNLDGKVLKNLFKN